MSELHDFTGTNRTRDREFRIIKDRGDGTFDALIRGAESKPDDRIKTANGGKEDFYLVLVARKDPIETSSRPPHESADIWHVQVRKAESGEG